MGPELIVTARQSGMSKAGIAVYGVTKFVLAGLSTARNGRQGGEDKGHF